MEKETQRIRIGHEFRPAPQLKRLYFYYLVVIYFFSVLIWYIPLLVVFYFVNASAFLVTLACALPSIAVFLFVVYWISRYYNTIVYKLTGNEIVWKRGVWFRNTGIVPYNRITNIDVSQGPLSRALGVAALKVQTAGYSATSGGGGNPSEIKIEGMEESEEVRELIMGFVRGGPPMAVETYQKDTNGKILEELERIRSLLERK